MTKKISDKIKIKKKFTWESDTRKKSEGCKCDCYCCRDTGIHFDYETVNILSENGDSIFSPEHNEYETNEILDFGPSRKGTLFVNVERLQEII